MVNLEQTKQDIHPRLSEHFVAYCIIGIIPNGDGTVTRAAISHVDPNAVDEANVLAPGVTVCHLWAQGKVHLG